MDNPPIICGPCQIENRELCIKVAKELVKINKEFGCNIIFKSSFDKANRTAAESPRGVGLDEGVKILGEVRKKYCLRTTSDIHEGWQAEKVQDALDFIQIPAFLARQTDLLAAAAKTGRAVSVKIPQWMVSSDITNIEDKLRSFGCEKIFFIYRASFHGYQQLVCDPINLLEIKDSTICPVILDVSHSVQSPGSLGKTTGGKRKYIEHLAKMAGVFKVGLFVETHPMPIKAFSDAAVQFPLGKLRNLIEKYLWLYKHS